MTENYFLRVIVLATPRNCAEVAQASPRDHLARRVSCPKSDCLRAKVGLSESGSAL